MSTIHLYFSRMLSVGVLLVLFQVNRVLMSTPFDLEDLVPAGYAKLVPPKPNENEPVNVTVGLYVIQIRAIDETEMDFKMDILIRQSWQDKRLNFPPDIGTKKIVLDPKWREHIWTPDVWFKNAQDTKLQEWEVPSVFYWLEKNTVCFSARVTLELSCDMEMQHYPHDIQQCGVDIMALMNPKQDLTLNWRNNRAIRLSRIVRLPQFDIGNIEKGRCDTYMYEEVFSCIKASFSLIRRSGYFIINIYIPTVLIVLMSMLTFWIPRQAVPARITLGVTSLLTIITKQYQSSMPNVSYIVALNIWLSSCVAFVFCSLLEFAIVITLEKKNMKVNPLNDDDMEEVMKQDENEDKVIKSSLKTAWKKKSIKILEKLSAEYVDYISRVLFPLTFALFCIAYCCKYSFG